MLGDLANVPSFDDRNWPARASEFVDKYGRLLPPSQVSALDGSEIAEYAKRFRIAWDAKNDPEKVAVVNSLLNEIFAASGSQKTRPFKGDPPVFSADFELGKWTPRPRTLLDVLAIELMRSRKMLHRCEACQRYFVKRYSREKYCKQRCGEIGREKTLEKYHEKHREERNAKRRQNHRKPHKRNSVRR